MQWTHYCDCLMPASLISKCIGVRSYVGFASDFLICSSMFVSFATSIHSLLSCVFQAVSKEAGFLYLIRQLLLFLRSLPPNEQRWRCLSLSRWSFWFCTSSQYIKQFSRQILAWIEKPFLLHSFRHFLNHSGMRRPLPGIFESIVLEEFSIDAYNVGSRAH